MYKNTVIVIALVTSILWYLLLIKKPVVPAPMQQPSSTAETEVPVPTTPKPTVGEDSQPSTSSFAHGDKTTHWQIYRDEKYGFEVMYPQDAVFKKEAGTDYVILRFSSKDTAVNPLGTRTYLNVAKQSKYKTVEDYRAFEEEMIKVCLGRSEELCRSFKTAKFGYVNVDGVRALVRTAEHDFKEISFVKESYLFSIGGRPFGSFEGKPLWNGVSVDQLIATFKFMK